MDKSALRDAATVLVIRRDDPAGPSVLMGRRGASAAFMPSKYVFPGGAVDAADAKIPLARRISEPSRQRLDRHAGTVGADALCAAAIRELWEETGKRLAMPGAWPAPPAADWQGFAAGGLLPDAGALHYIFRAITPPGRSRRFDARFFAVDMAVIGGDPDDFSGACDELADLRWVPFHAARQFDLPFITEVVLAEAQALAESGPGDDPVPFFDNSGEVPAFRRIA